MNVPEGPPTELSYTAITGRVYACPGLARRLKTMQWQTNLIYNATVAADRDFTAAVERNLAYAQARKTGAAPPAEVARLDGYRPLNQKNELIKALQPLHAAYPELQGPPVSVYENAILQAERARAKLVRDFRRLAPGAKTPKLHFRSMRDDVSITSDNCRLYERRGADWIRPPGPLTRCDSPRAIVGKKKIKLEVQGLGRFNANLSQPIPDGGSVKQIVVTMEAGHGKIRVRLVIEQTVASMRALIEARAWRAHEILRQMPEGLGAQDQIAWARAQGLRLRGDDLGVERPSMDDEGVASDRVTMTRHERAKVRDLQQKLSRLDQCAMNSLSPAERGAVVAGKARAPKRSKNAQRVRRRIARVRQTVARRAKTAAYADARRLTRNVDIIATDPPEMAAELVKKNGPAQRRARGAERGPRIKGPRDFLMSPAQQRALRHNMHTTMGAFRLRRVATLSRRLGLVHLMPGNRGTSSECPKCQAVKDSALNLRWHECSCGCPRMARDQASSQVTLGRAIVQLAASHDPGGRRAEMWAKEDKARSRREKRVAGIRASAERRRREKAGRSGPAMHAPGLPGGDTNINARSVRVSN